MGSERDGSGDWLSGGDPDWRLAWAAAGKIFKEKSPESSRTYQTVDFNADPFIRIFEWLMLLRRRCQTYDFRGIGMNQQRE